MKISVITPSYKQLRWLKLCLASVADQTGCAFEHIVQDAHTGKELEDWVKTHNCARLFVESDSGMYDAINRGFLKATGDIVAWLNCDEQYLPGTLAKVAAYFEQHPEVDVLFGDAVLLSDQGALLSYRRVILPSLLHTQLSHLNTLSCATFVRRSVIDRGLLLKTEWRAIADAVWVADLIQADMRMAVLNEPLAAFTMTEVNLGQSSLAFRESQSWRQQTTTSWIRLWQWLIVLWHRARKFSKGAYALRNFTTEIYTRGSISKRIPATAQKLTFAWTRSPRAGKSRGWWRGIREAMEELFKTGKRKETEANKSLPFSYYHPKRLPLIYLLLLPALCAVVILYCEQITTALIVAPMLSTILMLVLSFYLEPLHLLPFAATFCGVIYLSLHYVMPLEHAHVAENLNLTHWIRVGLRIGTFLIASFLAMLFSKYRLKARMQQDQTVEIIISMPVPVVISDALGTVIFANDELAEYLKTPREQIKGASYLKLFMSHQDEGAAMRDYIKFFQDVPEGSEAAIAHNQGLRLTMHGANPQEVVARFICLGKGEARHMVTVLKV